MCQISFEVKTSCLYDRRQIVIHVVQYTRSSQLQHESVVVIDKLSVSYIPGIFYRPPRYVERLSYFFFSFPSFLTGCRMHSKKFDC